MIKWVRVLLVCLSLLLPAGARAAISPIIQKPWLEARTEHFHLFSCGGTQEVSRVTARLEQFRSAYSMLAGTQAVVSPPIIVMAFPDQKSLSPFLPMYGNKPANIAGFFHRGRDENLIVLSLSESAGVDALQKIYHEYCHLLLRRNEAIWPLWLKEGMADIYSTFEVTGDHSARIGKPIPIYLHLLAGKQLMDLKDLFQVTAKSPEYNVPDLQELFYAESWLVAHYLMLGGNPSHRTRFGTYTVLLTQGQTAVQAFTNAFNLGTAEMLKQVRAYLGQGKFNPLNLSVKASLLGPRVLQARSIPKVETCFRLGDQLLRIGRLEDAKAYFEEAQALAPESPLSYEGLGLLAAETGNRQEALSLLGQAITKGSKSHLTYYVFGREKYRLLARNHTAEPDPRAIAEVRQAAEKALALVGDFGPAEHLLGAAAMAEGRNFKEAERHLVRAVELEPENDGYRLTLAHVQMSANDLQGARRTLEPLWRRSADPDLRKRAQEILTERK